MACGRMPGVKPQCALAGPSTFMVLLVPLKMSKMDLFAAPVLRIGCMDTFDSFFQGLSRDEGASMPPCNADDAVVIYLCLGYASRMQSLFPAVPRKVAAQCDDAALPKLQLMETLVLKSKPHMSCGIHIYV